MGVLHFRYRERRRTLRVALAYARTCAWTKSYGDKFCYKGVTRSVNRQGALVVLDGTLALGQVVQLVNENTNRPAETHVVNVKKERDGKYLVRLEFSNPEVNLWKMTFPVPGARPLRRPSGSKAMA